MHKQNPVSTPKCKLEDFPDSGTFSSCDDISNEPVSSFKSE